MVHIVRVLNLMTGVIISVKCLGTIFCIKHHVYPDYYFSSVQFNLFIHFIFIKNTVLLAVPVVTEITPNTIAISWREFTPYTHHIFIQEKDTDVILEEESYIMADQTTTHTFNVQPATLYQVTIETISSGGIIIDTNPKDVRSCK